MPFNIPKSWCWLKLEYVTETISTKPFQIKETEIKEFGRFPVITQSIKYISGYSDEESKLLRIHHPILLFGDHTTVVKLIDQDCIIGADGVKLFKTKSIVIPYYLYFVLVYNTYGMEKLGGYSRHYKFLKDKPIPIPPINEQHMIVKNLKKIYSILD